MAYKIKPNKSVGKRFRATKTGKLKRGHTLTSHLRSARDSKKKRQLRGTTVLYEGIARNMRPLMGLGAKHPKKTAHLRALAAKKKAAKPAKPA